MSKDMGGWKPPADEPLKLPKLKLTDGRSQRWKDAEQRYMEALSAGDGPAQRVALAIIEEEQELFDAANP